MPDDLRTRIAAAIRAVDDMRVCKLHDADIKFITEAVIGELRGEPLSRIDAESCSQEWKWLNDESRWLKGDDDDPYEAKADAERQQWADDEGIPR